MPVPPQTRQEDEELGLVSIRLQAGFSSMHLLFHGLPFGTARFQARFQDAGKRTLTTDAARTSHPLENTKMAQGKTLGLAQCGTPVPAGRISSRPEGEPSPSAVQGQMRLHDQIFA
jgi:hypothetical protein